MDDLDGLGLIKYINNNNKKLHFFIISSLGNNEDMLLGYSLKVIDYMTKQLNFDILNKKLINFLEYTYRENNKIIFGCAMRICVKF